MKRNSIAFGILGADIVATLLIRSRLPAQVPVHWGLHGADRFGSPWELVLLGPGALLLSCLLLIYLERIDPLASRPLDPEAPPAERGAFSALMVSLLVLMATAHVALLMHLAGLVSLSPRLGQLFAPVMFMLLGNFLPRVRPNFFAGVRTPWTLSSPGVWRRTNRLAGKLFFFGGLACAGLVFAPQPVGTIALVTVGLGAALVSCGASYVWWRQERLAARP